MSWVNIPAKTARGKSSNFLLESVWEKKHPAPTTAASTLSMSVSAWYCPLYPGYSISSFWANYNNSLTWIKAIWGWFPLLTMISRVRENSEVVIIYPAQNILHIPWPHFLSMISPWNSVHDIPILMLQAKMSSPSVQPESDFTWRIIPLIKYTHGP